MNKLALLFAILSVYAFGCAQKSGGACWDEGALVCTGKTTAVLCADHTWSATSCAGANGCTTIGARGVCDDSRVDVRVPCWREGQVSCSADGKSRVLCKGKAWTTTESCPGAGGCVANADRVWCDIGVSRTTAP